MNRSAVLIGFVLLLGSISEVLADGDSRPATLAEQDYSLHVLTTLSAVLPKPWPGWEATEGTELAPFESVSPGCEAAPLSVSYSITWVDPAQAQRERAEEDAAIARAAARIQAPDVQARMAAFVSQQEKLVEAQKAAEVERIQKEMEALGKQMESVASAQDAVLESETSGLADKSRLVIRMAANETYVTELEASVTDVGPVAGHPAFAYHDAEGRCEDRLTVLVGPWRRRSENGQVDYELTPDSALPYTHAQSVTVTIEGDPELARKLCGEIDWNALVALLK
jgi:predicted  nucleic acid-binding Zn-ribbon protein